MQGHEYTYVKNSWSKNPKSIQDPAQTLMSLQKKTQKKEQQQENKETHWETDGKQAN